MSNDIYGATLFRDATEQQRINQQFHIITTALGWVLHPSISATIPSKPSVADIATGTGQFLRTLAPTYPSATLDGYDISESMFPASSTLPANITLSIADAKQPFPAHLHGTYDLVHVRYLIAGMEPSEWAPVLAHLLALLKPGGAIQWTEPAISQVGFLRSTVTSRTATITRLSDVFSAEPIHTRIQSGWSTLPGLMREAGCERVEADVVSSDRVPETRRAVTENITVLLLEFAQARSAKGVPGAMTEGELRQAEEVVQQEIESGCYCRYDVHTAIGFKAKS
ncbi:MAG: hypothetical protein M1821_004108 [Bathelium mastoideum]|nr:MAG: hypothetical protein M1821_004108 [Bathelium mastoideum]KAI9691179.1 MAG: hypothetical protein M1822_008799 [Bathelium mastoideum]